MGSLSTLWDHFGVTLGSLWGHFGITSGSLWDHFEVTSGSLWGHLGSLWDHFGVILGSLWGHCLSGQARNYQQIVNSALDISVLNRFPINLIGKRLRTEISRAEFTICLHSLVFPTRLWGGGRIVYSLSTINQHHKAASFHNKI